MAKLSKKDAKEVNEHEGDFPLLEPSSYHLRLRDVDTTKVGKDSSEPYWAWEFEVVEPGKSNSRLWLNTSLSKAARFKLKEVFDAFEVEADTDTDELVGEVVKGLVTTRTIQGGARKGEPANSLDRLSPRDKDFEPPTSKSGDDLDF